jgi:hypothetical protein
MEFTDYEALIRKAVQKEASTATAFLLSRKFSRYHSSKDILPLLPENYDHPCSLAVIRFISRMCEADDEEAQSHELARKVLDIRDRIKLLYHLSDRRVLIADVIQRIFLIMFHSVLERHGHRTTISVRR